MTLTSLRKLCHLHQVWQLRFFTIAVVATRKSAEINAETHIVEEHAAIKELYVWVNFLRIAHLVLCITPMIVWLCYSRFATRMLLSDVAECFDYFNRNESASPEDAATHGSLYNPVEVVGG